MTDHQKPEPLSDEQLAALITHTESAHEDWPEVQEYHDALSALRELQQRRAAPRIEPASFQVVSGFAEAAATERVRITDTPDTRWWGIYVGSSLVGSAGLMSITPSLVKVCGVYVEPAHRGTGLGTKATEFVLSVAAGDGLDVEAYALNPAWYLRRGFTATGKNHNGIERVERRAAQPEPQGESCRGNMPHYCPNCDRTGLFMPETPKMTTQKPEPLSDEQIAEMIDHAETCGFKWPYDEALEALRELQQRRAAQPEPQGWQPIETAPKDGSYIIGALINRGTVWRVHEMAHNGLAFYNHAGGSVPRMTHWMPLPSPPKDVTP